MAAGRFQLFFGNDWDETLDSLMSAPGAFGNIFVGAIKQVRLVDVVALGLVIGGWLWLIGAFLLGEHLSSGAIVVSLLPTALWLAAGALGGVIFEVGGIGPRVLGYWESYVLIGAMALFGVVSLRVALNPRDRRVYRASSGTPPA